MTSDDTGRGGGVDLIRSPLMDPKRAPVPAANVLGALNALGGGDGPLACTRIECRRELSSAGLGLDSSSSPWSAYSGGGPP
jgi:hypothetical protein